MSVINKLKKVLYYTPINPYFIAKNNLLKSMKYSTKFSKGTIIDVGCGKKPYEGYFKPGAKNYFGIDYPDYTISHKFSMDVCADVQILPIKNAAADTIICNQVLEHIPNTDQLFFEINRVLNKEGILILTVPFFWGLHEEPRDYYRFTKYGLANYCNKHGLSVIEIQKLSGLFGMICQRICDQMVNPIKKINNWLFLLIIPITFILQCVGFIFDTLLNNYGDNLDWLLIAQKK